MVVVSHPTGNANVRGTLKALEEADQLCAYCTTLGYARGSLAERIMSLLTGAKAKRRSYDLPAPLLRTFPWHELRRHLVSRLPSRGTDPRKTRRHIDAMYFDFDAKVSHLIHQGKLPKSARAIYAYEDGCRDTFKSAGDAGLKRLYELPIGYWRAARKIFREEAEHKPEWKSTIAGLDEPEEKLQRKDEELQSSDHVYVASSFTRSTLDAAPFDLPPVSVIPYGAPAPLAGSLRQADTTAPLKVIFVGGLSQRKGIAYLFEAMNQVGPAASLTVIGRKPGGCPALERALARHRWIPSLPHEQVLREIREHDLLVFPSLFEGFGLVLVEALSQGVPVMATPHTAGPDLITDGEEGFLVPIRDSARMAERILQLARERDLLNHMKERALTTARSLSWEHYSRALVTSLAGLAA